MYGAKAGFFSAAAAIAFTAPGLPLMSLHVSFCGSVEHAATPNASPAPAATAGTHRWIARPPHRRHLRLRFVVLLRSPETEPGPTFPATRLSNELMRASFSSPRGLTAVTWRKAASRPDDPPRPKIAAQAKWRLGPQHTPSLSACAPLRVLQSRSSSRSVSTTEHCSRPRLGAESATVTVDIRQRCLIY